MRISDMLKYIGTGFEFFLYLLLFPQHPDQSAERVVPASRRKRKNLNKFLCFQISLRFYKALFFSVFTITHIVNKVSVKYKTKNIKTDVKGSFFSNKKPE